MKLKNVIFEKDGERGVEFVREDTGASVFLPYKNYKSGADMIKAAEEALK